MRASMSQNSHFCVILHDTHSHSFKCVILPDAFCYSLSWVCHFEQYTYSLYLKTFMSVSCHKTQMLILSCFIFKSDMSHNTNHTTLRLIRECLMSHDTLSFWLFSIVNMPCHTKHTLILLILSCFFWNNILPHKTHHHSFWPLNANLSFQAAHIVIFSHFI